MPRYVIHIGPGKTGSKYLQSSLYALRHELRQDGIDYAEDWWSRHRVISHEALKQRLEAGPDAETEQIFLRMRDSPCHTVILSCEGFYGLLPDRLKYWKTLLGPSPVEIVFYCRRWCERIPSVWQQRIKEGYFDTLPEHCFRTLQNPWDNIGINHAPAWQRFIAAFGPESLRLVSYSNLLDRNVDIFQHFLQEIVGWHRDFAIPKESIVENVSSGPEQIEMLRTLNHMHFLRTGKIDRRLRVWFSRYQDFARFEPLADMMRAELAELRIDDNTAMFDKIFDAFSAYRSCLVSPEYGTDIFERQAKDAVFVRPDYLVRNGALKAIRELYAALRSPPASRNIGS